MSGQELQLVTVPTIVTIEEPSQAFEGKSDPMPLLQGSFSPLSEGTSLKGILKCNMYHKDNCESTNRQSN